MFLPGKILHTCVRKDGYIGRGTCGHLRESAPLVKRGYETKGGATILLATFRTIAMRIGSFGLHCVRAGGEWAKVDVLGPASLLERIWREFMG